MKSAPAGLLVTMAVILTTSHGFRQLSANCPELCVGPGCSPEPEECGVLGDTEICGRRVCYKGPGDVCGTPYNQRGLCAPSLRCEHGICKGCVLINNEKNCSQWDHHFTERFFVNRYRNGY